MSWSVLSNTVPIARRPQVTAAHAAVILAEPEIDTWSVSVDQTIMNNVSHITSHMATVFHTQTMGVSDGQSVPECNP